MTFVECKLGKAPLTALKTIFSSTNHGFMRIWSEMAISFFRGNRTTLWMSWFGSRSHVIINW